MAPKTAKIYTLEELKAKCQGALTEQNLVDVARLTPGQAHDKAFEYVYEKTKDLQTAKKLAVATRFLAILRRDHREEFEKLVVREKQPESNTKQVEPEKRFADEEFAIPRGVELISRYGYNAYYGCSSDYIKFCDPLAASKFSVRIINALVATERDTSMLLNDLIQLLEEKFGLKVKVCGNCRYLGKIPWPEVGYMLPENNIGGRWPCRAPPDRGYSTDEFRTCKYWSSKKISEKKEN